MKSIQEGFTLIELMIVVAIIGILAATAIPAYNDYTARAQVTEALQLSASFKTGLLSYYQDIGVWPSNLTAVGSTTSGIYVQSVEITSGGGTSNNLVITATMSATDVAPAVASELFALTTTTGGKTWDCGRVGLAGTITTLPGKYIPSACK